MSLGRTAEALASAQAALATSDLSAFDEAMLAARFPGRFLTTDYDRRVDALLSDRKASDASRLLGSTSPTRRAAFQAR